MGISVDELKERYKMLPVWARLAVAFSVGLTPGIYLYFDEGDALNDKLVESQQLVLSSRQKFEAAREKKANLPQLEEQMAFTEEQLAKAKLKLPDRIVIEDVLQKTATIAKQTGVQLSAFNPSPDIIHTQPYQYVEAPIAAEITGRFAQVATFLDQMIHLDGTIFMRHIELTRHEPEDKKAIRANQDEGPISAFDLAQNARHDLQVHAKFDIVVYRSMNDHDQGPSESPPVGGGKAKAAPPSAPAEAAAAAGSNAGNASPPGSPAP